MNISKEEWTNALYVRHGKLLQDKFFSSTVAICGLGGLGSHIAITLARMGIGNLILIDFDKVDITNIHRQQYKASQVGMFKADAIRENIYEIAPFAKITTVNAKLCRKNIPHILKDAQIICEAFDDATAKAELCDYVFSEMPEKYLVCASGMAGFGDANEIHTRKINNHFYVCGDETSDVIYGTGLVASRVMLCAAHQAHAIIKIIGNELI